MPVALIWPTLGVAATRDVAEIRRAYATKLKAIDQEQDPEGFQRLRAAYEAALALARRPQVVSVGPRVTPVAPADPAPADLTPAADLAPHADPVRPAGPSADPVPRTDLTSGAGPLPRTDLISPVLRGDPVRRADPQPRADLTPPVETVPRPDLIPPADAVPRPDPVRRADPVPRADFTPNANPAPQTNLTPTASPTPRANLVPPAAPVLRADFAPRGRTPAVTRVEPDAQSSADIVATRAALDALRLALAPGSTADQAQLKQLLEHAIDTAARGNLAIQQDAENLIAQLMVAAGPRSDPLLDECVRRYGWERHETDLAPNRAVLAVLTRRRDIAALADFKSRQDGLGLGFKRLTHPARPKLRWYRANFPEIGQWPEWAVIRHLKDRNPMLLRELDAAQVAWWERFMSRPRFSFGMVRIGGKLTIIFVIMALLGEFSPAPWWQPLLSAVGLVALYSLALALRLYLVDWPTLLVIRRWSGFPPLYVQLGWLPALILVFGITALLPEAPALWWIPAFLGTLGCLWAIYASGPVPSIWQNRTFVLSNSHAALAVLSNAAVAPWWFLSVAEFTSPMRPAPFGTRTAAALSLMGAAGCGVRVLGKVWMERLNESQRKWITLGLLVLALALAPAVWFGAAHLALRPLMAWLVVSFVVAHRIACLNFNVEQVRLRAVVMIVAAVVGVGLASKDTIPMAAPMIQLGSVVLFGGAVLSLIMALHNQRERGF